MITKRPKALSGMSDKLYKVHSKLQDKYIDWLYDEIFKQNKSIIKGLDEIEKLIKSI